MVWGFFLRQAKVSLGKGRVGQEWGCLLWDGASFHGVKGVNVLLVELAEGYCSLIKAVFKRKSLLSSVNQLLHSYLKISCWIKGPKSEVHKGQITYIKY